MAALLVGSTPPAQVLGVVAIDAGHGGEQDGAIGVCGAREKDVTLAIARELAKLLEASALVQPLLLRDADLDVALAERAAIANTAAAVLMVSIHANASTNAEARGVETFVLSDRAVSQRLVPLVERENEGVAFASARENTVLARILNGLDMNAAHQESQRLAVRLQTAMNNRLETRGRGVLQAPFIVLLGAQMPAALVEVGFLTHVEECRLLSTVDHQRAIAHTLAVAILEHVTTDNPALAQR
ncbi:MAG: N-acetylmuramoyl-L-alanine amidase [Deltaproteobacteria bacterium]|nr:N-acetylmuramoyl-L-alanine amidase [Deltaproteobacteria bacterium]